MIPRLWRWVNADPERRARLLRWAWLVSLGVLALGYALIVLGILGYL